MNIFDVANDGREVQALVRSGFKTLTHCRYLLLQVSGKRQAAAWIGKLLERDLITRVADVRSDSGDRTAKVRETVQVAFSHRALKDALGLPISEDYPFPTIFAQGMAAPERASLVGDDPKDRAAWRWRDVDQQGDDVDLLVAHYRDSPFEDAGLLAPDRLAESGLRLIELVETCPFFVTDETEPFGFRDGVSQPYVPGLHSERQRATNARPEGAPLRAKGKAKQDPNALPPGELLLGQLNCYGERSYCPDVKGFSTPASDRRFAANGSYLAVRQIWQDTAGVAQFDPELAHVTGNPMEPVTPFERIIGRRKGGAPIRACPAMADTAADNDFLFRVDDYEGFHCPRGAHVRRGNPRDALGWDSESGVFASRLHRILRRGRVYRDAGVCDETGSCNSARTTNCGKGLFFIALNADLERQFEFVQRQWLANDKFGNLWQERDALGGGDFSIPGYMPVGTRLTGLPQFTGVIGGGYFFLPSLSALKFIVEWVK
ncbi:MAG: Dyp-type peroxidase [Burkholderiaceae bacterium]